MKLAFKTLATVTWGEGDPLCIIEDFADGSEPIVAEWERLDGSLWRVDIGNWESTGMVSVNSDTQQWQKLITFPSAAAALTWATAQDWTDEFLLTFDIQP